MSSTIRYSRKLRFAIIRAQIREVAYVAISRYLGWTGLALGASKLNYTAALEKARMDAIITAVGNAGKFYMYSGTQPAGPGTTHSNTLIAGPFTCGSPFGTATTALPSVLSPTLPANVNASSTGQPTWGRVCTSAGDGSTNGVIDYSAGTSGCDITVGSATSGQPVAITGWTHTSANYGH